MKLKLPIFSVLTGLCYALACFSATDVATDHIKAMRADGSITNVLSMLIADGTVCAIHGHVWVQHQHLTLEYAPSRVGCRICSLCNLHQSQYVTEWK